MHLRGAITIVSADNPASTLMGGFKQSASAFCCCRHCMASHEHIQSKVYMRITIFLVNCIMLCLYAYVIVFGVTL